MSDKGWDYRVVRQTTEKGITSAGNGDSRLSVQEVYYDDETGEPMAHSIDLQLEGDNIADLRTTLQRMLWCLDKDVVDEIESDIKNDWTCEICGKSTKYIEHDYIGSGTNHLQCDLKLDDDSCGTQRLTSKHNKENK